jgi:hypothetical protein
MTVSTYTVVAAFVSVLEFALGAVALVAAVRLLVRREPHEREDGAAAQALFLPGVVLAGLSALSIPLLYLLLRSWVPQWPDAMCVQGVARIGAGASGATGLLPSLLSALVVTKPLVAFAAGAWILVHLADRRTETAPLAGRVVLLLGVSGAAAVLDAALEGTYLLLPKVQPAFASGCCTTATLVPGGDGVAAAPLAVTAALVATALGAALAAHLGVRALASGRVAATWSVASAVCAVGTLWSGSGFLSGVLAPSRLRLPFHGCVHCLLDGAPEYAAAVALGLVGAWCAGWAAVVSGSAAGTAAAEPARALCRRLLGVASFALPAAAAMGLSGWWLA